MALLDDIKFQFRTGNVLMQLIYINAGVFLLMFVLRLFFYLTGNVDWFQQFAYQMTIPSDPISLLWRPWSAITHMFWHINPGANSQGLQEFLHILFNMAWLYFGGSIFLRFMDSTRLLSTYVLGGFSGAMVYLLAMNLFPIYEEVSVAYGASAAVLAVMVAVATKAPNFVVPLRLIGNVKLKYIAISIVLLDILFLRDGNDGGHFGHLGGALFGFVYVSQMKVGRDFTVDFMKPILWVKNSLPKRDKKIKVVHRKPKSDHEFNVTKAEKQVQIDAILDKIKRSGYESLSKTEKEILFKTSKEI
jgi:membrane associated rhomboid family serine protease